MSTPPLTPPEKLPSGLTPAPSKTLPKAPPLQPRKPNIQPTPVHITLPAPREDEETDAAPEDDSDNSNGTRSVPMGAPRKCPNCLYFPMKPLADFKNVDIEKTFGSDDDFYQSRGFLYIFPFVGLFFGLFRVLSNAFFSKADFVSKAVKVQRAKTEILDRCPNSLICPECCEVLEIY
jgi:hypothetical protein